MIRLFLRWFLGPVVRYAAVGGTIQQSVWRGPSGAFITTIDTFGNAYTYPIDIAEQRVTHSKICRAYWDHVEGAPLEPNES